MYQAYINWTDIIVKRVNCKEFVANNLATIYTHVHIHTNNTNRILNAQIMANICELWPLWAMTLVSYDPCELWPLRRQSKCPVHTRARTYLWLCNRFRLISKRIIVLCLRNTGSCSSYCWVLQWRGGDQPSTQWNLSIVVTLFIK